MKWGVGVVIMFVVVIVVWMTNTSPQNNLHQEEVTLSPKPENDTSEKMVVNSVQKIKPAVEKKAEGIDSVLDGSDMSYNQMNAVSNEAVTPHNIESALDSMREGLAEGDSRTPALSEPLEYEQPTLDEINDPALYQQYEKRQSLNQASAYFSAAVKELPVLRAKIAQARQNGSQTEEEIQEAEEALQKLELMQLEYQWQMPEASKNDIPDE